MKRILTDYSERLNSAIEWRRICKVKFHRGVEFNLAIEISLLAVIFFEKIY